MAFFSWLETSEVDEFAKAIAADLVKRIPPASLEAGDAKAAKKLAHTHQAVFSRAGTFAQTHKLNVYKKARLGNQFRWALKEAGYPSEFIESWTYELVTLITLRSGAKK
jgi:hypothetical protein